MASRDASKPLRMLSGGPNLNRQQDDPRNESAKNKTVTSGQTWLAGRVKRVGVEWQMSIPRNSPIQ